MGIQVEYNPDLALRAAGTPGRSPLECLPETLKAGSRCPFLKVGQRNYWLDGEIPLVETKGKGRLSRPLASIKILEVTHRRYEGRVITEGEYLIMEVYDPKDPTIHFEGMNKVKIRGKK